MADLKTEVQRRYSDQYLLNVTNPDAPEGTAFDIGKLDAAVEDANAWFVLWGQTNYDENDTLHVAIGVEGVIAFLTARGAAGGDAAEERITNFREKLEQLTQVQTRKRMNPATQSKLRTTEASDVYPRMPDFHREKFRFMQLGDGGGRLNPGSLTQ